MWWKRGQVHIFLPQTLLWDNQSLVKSQWTVNGASFSTGRRRVTALGTSYAREFWLVHNRNCSSKHWTREKSPSLPISLGCFWDTGRLSIKDCKLHEASRLMSHFCFQELTQFLGYKCSRNTCKWMKQESDMLRSRICLDISYAKLIFTSVTHRFKLWAAVIMPCAA